MKRTKIYFKFKLSTIVNASMLLFLLFVMLSCAQTKKDEVLWVHLLDGNSLAGWTALSGNATYDIKNVVITGTTVIHTINTYLSSDVNYDNLILESEFKVHPEMNSGIQIRSNSFPYYQGGNVHGYQFEIDPSKRTWSAGIFDQSKRGWLHPVTKNIEVQNAFKQNDWNHYRIETINDSIKTWINGVPASFLIDDKTASGFISLQVHSIAPNQKEGTEKQWRNTNILTENLEKHLLKTPLTPIVTKNKLTKREKETGWKMLRDGLSTKCWRDAKLDHFPKQALIDFRDRILEDAEPEPNMVRSTKAAISV